MPQSGGQKDTLSSIIAQSPSLEGLSIHSSTRIATLWSNYGSIDRVYLQSSPSTKLKRTDTNSSIIVKTVKPPSLRTGEQADESHTRKLLSYEIERFFYSDLSSRLSTEAKVACFHPICPPTQDEGNLPVQIVLEDLSIEYPIPARGSLNYEDTRSVLSWLAAFHGTFWGVQREPDIKPKLVPPPLQYKGGNMAGIWEQGTYWYLDTRRDEFDCIDGREYGWILKWVDKVDAALKRDAGEYGTLLHGDVKGANIVFSGRPFTTLDARSRCALYDFQYVGVGLVTRDLVYFLGTTAQSGLLRNVEQEKELLRAYHADLIQSVGLRLGSRRESPKVATDDEKNIEYPFTKLWNHWELALVDWCRFMAGWGFWGNDSWVERRAKQIVVEWDSNGFPYLEE